MRPRVSSARHLQSLPATEEAFHSLLRKAVQDYWDNLFSDELLRGLGRTSRLRSPSVSSGSASPQTSTSAPRTWRGYTFSPGALRPQAAHREKRCPIFSAFFHDYQDLVRPSVGNLPSTSTNTCAITDFDTNLIWDNVLRSMNFGGSRQGALQLTCPAHAGGGLRAQAAEVALIALPQHYMDLLESTLAYVKSSRGGGPHPHRRIPGEGGTGGGGLQGSSLQRLTVRLVRTGVNVALARSWWAARTSSTTTTSSASPKVTQVKPYSSWEAGSR